MKKILFLFFIINACKQPANDIIAEYYNPEKWKWTERDPMGWLFYQSVKGKPKKVQEFFISNRTEDYRSYNFPAHSLRKFDGDGNTSYLEETYHDSSQYIQSFLYDTNGMQRKDYAGEIKPDFVPTKNDTLITSSVKISYGKYKVNNPNRWLSWDGTYSIYSYFNNGRKIIIDEYMYKLGSGTGMVDSFSTNGDLEVVSTVIKEFDERNQLTKYEYLDRQKQGFMYEYRYDKNGFLDCILIVDSRKQRSKIIIENDEYGNPTKVDNEKIEYDYDEKGNWIRRIQHKSKGDITTVRKIFY